ncbi:MAG: quinol:cytochrome C oxidoreductase [Chlorobi bacterium]|nr:quinol:cytochrome C oxidoreductase [Chlorobiota bacterium]
MMLISVSVGSLFLISLEYIAGAVWSTPFRRIFEHLASIVLVLPIVALPILFNLHDVFHWMHQEVMDADPILQSKAPYLNETFFLVRVGFYFAVWILFYFLLTSNSKKQDKTKDQKLTKRNITISAIFLPVFALTISFAAIDFMMSLEPHWFSTIFGVYYFSGTVLASLSAGTFIMVYLSKKNLLFKGISEDHYYSFGALLFAFINFWAYIAFSQFLLIWYANLPEETVWFLQRWEGSWMYISILTIIVHFAVPYFGLLSQPSKMNPKRLASMSLWIIFAHYLDLYWIVMPTFSESGFVFGWIEIGYFILGLGIIISVFVFKASKGNLIPIGDPKLKRGINFRL